MTKTLFWLSFIKELLGIIVVMGSDHSCGPIAKNILDHGTSWKMICHEKWPLGNPA
jgi:hypothetical protein